MASVILATAPIHGHVSAYLSSWPSMEETEHARSSVHTPVTCAVTQCGHCDPCSATTSQHRWTSHRPAWSRNRFAHGSYSSNAFGSTRADRVALAEPIAGRIFFAGEATEPDYSSTVHGAYETGHRVARQVGAAIG